MKTTGFAKIAGITALFCIAALASHAQTFTTLHSFDVSDGYDPVYGTLVQGTDGNFYGTTSSGGTNENGTGKGTIFKITPQGKLTSVYSFCSQFNSGVCTDGSSPEAGVIQAANGNLYGTTFAGGNPDGTGGCTDPDGCGTAFEITSTGKLTTLYNFCSQANCTDGQSPLRAALVQASNGNLYGATAEVPPVSGGTIFGINHTGTLSTLFSFCFKPTCPIGFSLNTMVQAANGAIYGTTFSGGAHKGGTFFAFLPGGKFATLHSFNPTSEGSGPSAPILASDGNFYGTTTSGGANSYGTVYKITPAGTVTTLYSFCTQPGCTDGAFPIAGLVQGSDGNFYGITANGGNTPDCAKFTINGCGTIFEISPSGQFTKLYTLCSQTNCADGIGPLAALNQGTDGSFYGTTPSGGILNDTCFNGCGTVFRFSTGLAPFVKPNPTFGKVGYKINILGNNLSGTTSVTFNGTAATFSIVSDTFIKATVPTGATTGTIQVTTPSGKLTSNVAFQVIP